MKITQLDKNDVNNIIKLIAEGERIYCISLRKDFDSVPVKREKRDPMEIMLYVNAMTSFTLIKIIDVIEDKNAIVVKIDFVDEESLNNK